MVASSLVSNGSRPAASAQRAAQWTGQWTAQWTAEIDVTPRLAADLISAQFPDLTGQDVTLLATGWDNNAFVVGSRWLFRFPRREIALPGVRREIALLPALAARLPRPIPDPRFVGRPSPDYPWPFFGARLLAGGELADSGLDLQARTKAAAALGGFLHDLHDPGLVPLTEHAGLPTDPMGRANPPLRAERAREVLGRLADLGIWRTERDVLDLLDQASRAPAGGGETSSLVVTHGDLHIRHVLVDPSGAVTGVIDWGDLCLGDPAIDLSIAYFGFAGPERAGLLAAYDRPVGPARKLAARTLAISLAASLAEYAADQNRQVLLAECLAGLENAVAA
jgi:aminoglycoside phosphotransferase (APT) family kinase protein